MNQPIRIRRNPKEEASTGQNVRGTKMPHEGSSSSHAKKYIKVQENIFLWDIRVPRWGGKKNLVVGLFENRKILFIIQSINTNKSFFAMPVHQYFGSARCEELVLSGNNPDVPIEFSMMRPFSFKAGMRR